MDTTYKRVVARQSKKSPPGKRAGSKDPVKALEEGRSVAFGGGLVSTAPHIPLSSAIEVPPEGDSNKWEVAPRESVLASLQLLVDRSTIEKVVDAQIGGSGLISGITLGASAGYNRTVRQSEYALTFAVAIHVVTQSKRLKEYVLTQDAKNLLAIGRDEFARAYGDYFCSEKLYGGMLVAVGRYQTSSTVLSEVMQASLEANGVWFGGWASFQEQIKKITNKERYQFTSMSEGVSLDFPAPDLLKDPAKFIVLVNNWIKAAKANKAIPIRDNFTPYSAVPKIGTPPPSADFIDFTRLVGVGDQARDLSQTVLDVKANPDAFKGTPQEKKALLDAAQKYATSVVRSCDEEMLRVFANPWKDVQVPEFQLPQLPEQNEYSKEAILDHLTRGYKVTVTLKERLVLSEKEKKVLEAGKAYEVFIRGGDIWYCIPPAPSDPRPSDVTYKKLPALGELWIWGGMLRYDNTGEVVHTSGVKGQLEVNV